MIERLPFKPLPGLKSPHLQMIVASQASIPEEPPSENIRIDLTNGDQLVARVSTPPMWKKNDKTVAFVHGLGGSSQSGYLIRLAKQFFSHGIRVVRINLRGCGEGVGLSALPYHSGTSNDVRLVVDHFGGYSPLYLVGFSLGGNLILKMAGEGILPLKRLIAVCPVLQLKTTQASIAKFKHRLYQTYYLKSMKQTALPWIGNHHIRSIKDFDEKVIAPCWGFKNADDYYSQCSSLQFIPEIQNETFILLAKDDPFIDYHPIFHIPLPETVHVFITEHGSHMGFIGYTKLPYNYYWMDEKILEWVLYD